MRRRYALASLFLATVLLLVTSCQSIAKVGTAVGVATGTISEEQADSINRSAEAVDKSFEDITPEQEYYIGRSVGAVILDQYDPYDAEAANAYINRLGQSLALASKRPELFGGYRFQILDTEEINAFATPSGLVFISRGMLRLAKSESDVAAILAHEIGHIVHQHGLKAIKTSRLNTALTSVALTSVQVASDEEIAELTSVFEDSVQDITGTLVNSGYSRRSEREADEEAIEILLNIGYEPESLLRVLSAMDRQWDPEGPGFAKTHPDPEDRIAYLDDIIDGRSVAVTADARERRNRRYRDALSGV